jgi:hypothetical protein
MRWSWGDGDTIFTRDEGFYDPCDGLVRGSGEMSVGLHCADVWMGG